MSLSAKGSLPGYVPVTTLSLSTTNAILQEEIVSIAKKRSGFEHIINARGSTPSDYMRYIEFEKNVDALRRKRIKRLGVKSTGSGQRTVFFLYNRGVRKFQGDLDLWLQYIEFARNEKAYKKLNEIFTSVVRLHPTKPGIWIYAARYFMDTQGDITNARSYMQRGLRFNKNSETIWLEYAKLETIYVAKIAGRRKILGLDIDRTQKATEEDADADIIALPSVTAEDINPNLGQDDGVDQVALENLASTPVLTGAIPIAIFDSAMNQFKNDPLLAERFFDMFADFDQLPCLKRILQHVVNHLQQTSPGAASTVACELRWQLLGMDPTSPEFPSALRAALGMLDTAIQQRVDTRTRLAGVAIREILPALRAVEDADEAALKKVLLSSLRKYSRTLEESTGGANGDAIAELAGALLGEERNADAKRLIESSMKHYRSNEKLLELQKSLGT
jgi:U3 small nucleolar RNA-associated protein 6